MRYRNFAFVVIAMLLGVLAAPPTLADIPVLTGASGVGNQDTNFTYYKPNNSNPLIPVGIPAHQAWIKPTSGAWIGPLGGNKDGQSGRYISILSSC